MDPKDHDICLMCDGFQQSKNERHIGNGWNGYMAVSLTLLSASLLTDLISTGNFLHFPESGVELANEVVLPPGVIIPH